MQQHFFHLWADYISKFKWVNGTLSSFMVLGDLISLASSPLLFPTHFLSFPSFFDR